MRSLRLPLTVLLAVASFAAPGFAQSPAGFTQGQVPTAAEWNNLFAGKIDVTGGNASGANVTANGTTVALGTWLGYLTGTPAPVQINIGGAADSNAAFVAKVNTSGPGGQANAAWFEGEGGSTSTSALGTNTLRVVYQSNSVNRGTILNFREMNSAGTVLDEVAMINPGLQWWDAGHEETDYDFGGYVNGIYGVQIYMSAGCVNGYNTAANNASGIGCPVTTPPTFGPVTDNVWSLGLSGSRWSDVESVKVTTNTINAPSADLVLSAPAGDAVNELVGGNIVTNAFPTGTTDVNYLGFQSAPSGSPPILKALGGDANINLKLVPKGAGVVDASAGVLIGFGTPATSSATCTQGQIEFDASYVYTCVAANTWRRVATSSF